jgi:uncharacterized protein (DUF1800 family)
MKAFCLWVVSALALHAAGTISVAPINEPTVTGTTRQYTATVTGLASTAVNWYVNGVQSSATYGSIDANGLYTAPMSVPANPTVTIQAVSAMDPTVVGAAQSTIKTPGPVLTTLTPSSVTVGSFVVTINGTGFQPGASVILNSTTLTTTYVSSTQLSASGTMNTVGYGQIRASNPNSVFSNMLSLYFSAASSFTLAVQPSPAGVVQGMTQQFTAMLNGAPQAVVWSATAGTISASGLYTAPAAIPNPPVATIKAMASNGTSATAAVTIVSNQPPSISQVSPAPVPLGVLNLSITGSGFSSATQTTLGGAPLTTQYVSPTQIVAAGFNSTGGALNLVAYTGGVVSPTFVVQVGVANPMVTAAAARRFLQQASFGPTPADAAHVQQVGFQQWINEQFAMPAISNFAGINGVMGTHFITNAVTQPDQLRQRVGFALSQILVTSLVKSIWSTIEGPYQDKLLQDAFLNYRQILEDVTLHPTMGQYLDMANNGKANSAGTILPNENYAREVLQLFSVGTVKLNQDGTPQLDAQGNRIPTYDQTTIAEFARVFTGWTNAPPPGQSITWNRYMNVNSPLVAYPPMHDIGSKTLLNGAVVAANGSPYQDLTAALDNMFNHPNAGPFIGKLLIQHLVKSNPTPPYVARVAAAFNGAGGSPRGDMKAVITAILLDPEARQNDNGISAQSKDGHLQEPALFLAGLLRAMSATVTDQNYFNGDLVSMGQDIYNSPSVFNYYSSGYVIPGAGVTGGEFQIFTPYTAVYRANLASGLFSNYSSAVQTNGPGMTIDLTALVNLAGNASLLVDALDFTLTNGTMPSAMKQILAAAVQAEAGGNIRKVQTAVYLILQSGYYNVWF